jgi:hypothetical protein
MGQVIKSFGHGHFHIPLNIQNSYSKIIRADHPIIQLLASSGAAVCSFLLLQEYFKGVNALAMVAGTSAFLIVSFLFDSTSKGTIILNLLAAPLVFGLAIASQSGSSYLLIAAFVIHALVAEGNSAGEDKEMKTPLHCWAIYNLSLALLLI